jgi:hypothetical protein
MILLLSTNSLFKELTKNHPAFVDTLQANVIYQDHEKFLFSLASEFGHPVGQPGSITTNIL